MNNSDESFKEQMATQIVLNYLISILDNEKQQELKQAINSLAITPSSSSKKEDMEGKIIARAQELVDCGIASSNE